MKRYSNFRDLTSKDNSPAPGTPVLRRCWACNINKETAGGRVDKRTRLWHCAACVQQAAK
jgi:hypothetical protein